MRWVVDSNVVVSAMLSPHGPPALVVRAVLQGDAVLLHDDRILGEYREVFSRPRFGFAPRDVRDLVEGLRWTGESVVASVLPVDLPDADDLPFLEVAVSGVADALVTGNARHFRPTAGRHRVPIASPRNALGLLARTR